MASPGAPTISSLTRPHPGMAKVASDTPAGATKFRLYGDPTTGFTPANAAFKSGVFTQDNGGEPIHVRIAARYYDYIFALTAINAGDEESALSGESEISIDAR